MKIRDKIILIMVIATLLTLMGMAWKLNVELREDNRRMAENVRGVSEALQGFQTADDRIGVQNSLIAMKLEELSILYPSLQSEIENLKVKPQRVVQIQGTHTESEKVITTLLRDSVIMDTVQIRVFDYEDGYYTVKGQSWGDTQRVEVKSRDTLVQVVYKGKRERPVLWIFSPRKLEQRLVLKNPNARIVYNKNIQIQK